MVGTYVVDSKTQFSQSHFSHPPTNAGFDVGVSQKHAGTVASTASLLLTVMWLEASKRNRRTKHGENAILIRSSE